MKNIFSKIKYNCFSSEKIAFCVHTHDRVVRRGGGFTASRWLAEAGPGTEVEILLKSLFGNRPCLLMSLHLFRKAIQLSSFNILFTIYYSYYSLTIHSGRNN